MPTSTVRLAVEVAHDRSEAHVTLLVDGIPRGWTVVLPHEIAAMKLGIKAPDVAVAAADAIRGQLLPHGWPLTTLSLSGLATALFFAWDGADSRGG